MKWCVVGFDIAQDRYQILSDWMNQKGFANSVEFVELSPTELVPRMQELQQKYDQIRIEKPFRNEIFVETKKHEASMLLIRSADCFFKDSSGMWWLRSPLYYGINKILNSLGDNMDLDGSALVVGVGGAARTSIASLVKVGYRHFNITNAFDDQAIELVAELRKMYFSVTFQFISQGQLVLLPGTNSIVVNATPFLENNDILDELHYFNFLNRKGLVWEFTLTPVETPFTKEAVEIGARIFRGFEFAAATDEKWCQWVVPDMTFDLKDYAQVLRDKFSQNPAG